MGWIDDARGKRVLDVARALGLAVRERGERGEVYGCPACGAATRHASRGDPRGAIGTDRTGRGWRCHACSAGGDAIDLVAHARCGRRLAELDDGERAKVREWFVGGATTLPTRPMQAVKAPAPSPYLPPDELAAVWGLGRRVDVVRDVDRWLRDERRIDAGAVADRDLARVLGADDDLPRWGRTPSWPWRTWPKLGYGLLLPLFDGRGELRSFIFRRPAKAKDNEKSRSARGERRGLAMLCPLARSLLRDRKVPEVWPHDARLVVHVVEGEMDFLTLATAYPEAHATAPAVIGIVSGSAPILAFLPACELVVTTHDDDSGAKYRAAIVDALRDRPDIKLTLAEPGDINDRRKAGQRLISPQTADRLQTA